MPNEPIVAPADRLPIPEPAPPVAPSAWDWATGYKAILGVLLIAGATAAELYGIPNASIIRDAGIALLGLGLASKGNRILAALGSK